VIFLEKNKMNIEFESMILKIKNMTKQEKIARFKQLIELGQKLTNSDDDRKQYVLYLKEVDALAIKNGEK
jgi:sulfur transfer protein SufE